jgi:hypothetical protein
MIEAKKRKRGKGRKEKAKRGGGLQQESNKKSCGPSKSGPVIRSRE